MSSMTITSSSAQKVGYSSVQSLPSFSLKGIALKAFMVAACILQTGITPVSADQLTVYPAKMPEYCARRDHLSKYGVPFTDRVSPNVFCFLDSVNKFRGFAEAQVGDERLLAEYTLGKREACPFQTIGPFITSGREFNELSKRVEKEHLEGMARMYRSGCLEVIFPEKEEGLNACFERYAQTQDVYPMSYKIAGCRYVVTGALICPDQQRFETLRDRFLQRV